MLLARGMVGGAFAAAFVCASGLVSPAAAGHVTSRLLVLSAYPAELDPLVGNATDVETHVIGERAFYVGKLSGKDVVMALTGIGLENARATTLTALENFDISGMIFSGVAGGEHIGDVAIPSRWTLDDGDSWMRVDRYLFCVARRVAQQNLADLGSCVPAGDPACTGQSLAVETPLCVDGDTQVRIGGDGKSADTFGGRMFPCVPFGGDVFGCEPCRAPERRPPDVPHFVSSALPFVDPDFFFGPQTPATTEYDAEDMETGAAAAAVLEFAKAHQREIPFIAFRAASDGGGDPLMLPGFPFQFFVYQRLAAENAAAFTWAFLGELGEPCPKGKTSP